MKRRASSETLELFFPPRLPLFLIGGALLLAMLGGIATDLVKFYIGERPVSIWLMFVLTTATLIYTAYVIGLIGARRLGQHQDRVSDKPTSRPGRPMTRDQIKNTGRKKNMCHALEEDGVKSMGEIIDKSRQHIESLFDLKGQNATLKPLWERIQLLNEIRTTIRQAEITLPGWQPEKFWQQLGGALFLSLEEKKKIADGIVAMPVGQLGELVENLDQQALRFSRMLGMDLFLLLTGAIRAGRLANYTDIEGADAEALRQGNQSLRVIARLAKQDTTNELTLFDEVEKILPDVRSPHVWLLWANKIKKLNGSLERLEWAYSQIKALSGHDAITWNDYGNLLTEYLQRPDEAEEAYRKAIKLDPTFAYPWNNLGKLLKDHLKRFDHAERAYRRALELDPYYATPWKGLGSLLHYHLTRYQEAEAAYRKALEIEPDNSFTWHDLGILLSDKLNEPEEAEKAYRKAVELSPNNATFLNNLAWQLYLNNKALDEAEVYSRRSIMPGPAYRIHIHTLASILIKRGKWSEAVEYTRDFICRENDRLHERTWSDIILFFREVVATGHTNEAVELLDQTECSERWRPLREALRAISIDDSSYLLFVAPEVRQPAEEIITMLLPEGAKLRNPSKPGTVRRS